MSVRKRTRYGFFREFVRTEIARAISSSPRRRPGCGAGFTITTVEAGYARRVSHGYFDRIAVLVNVGFKTAKRKEFCQIEVLKWIRRVGESAIQTSVSHEKGGKGNQ